jgi:hypothetical protein
MTPKGHAELFRANAGNCDRRAKDTDHPKIAGGFRLLARRWRELAAQVESFSELGAPGREASDSEICYHRQPT